MATDPQPDQQKQEILRKNRWISLLSTSNDDENNEIEGRSDEYFDQIRLDAIRTLKRFPPSKIIFNIFKVSSFFSLLIFQIIPKMFDTIYKTN